MNINLLHLSDIHFNKNSGDSYDLDKALRYQVELDCKRLQQTLGDFSGILITGDVSFSATKEQFSKAEIWLKELCEIINCDPGNVWMTPGNHDVNRNKHKESKSLRDIHERIRSLEMKRFDTELFDILRDVTYQQSLYSPLSEYIDFAGRYSCSISPQNPFWKEKENRELTFPSGHSLNLIGLNSVLVSNHLDNPQKNKLFIGSHQLYFDESPRSINITLCHHPYDWLIDKDKVNHTLSLKTHVSLFGHKHEQWITPEKPCETKHVSITAGAVHPEREGQDWLPRFNALVFEVENRENQHYLGCKIYSRFYSKDEEKFIPEIYYGKEYYNYSIPLDVLHDYSQQEDGRIESTEGSKMNPTNDIEKDDDGSVKLPLITKKELNFRFLRLQYFEIVKIGIELGLMEEEDRNGVKDYELTKRFIQRAEENNIMNELSSRVLDIYNSSEA